MRPNNSKANKIINWQVLKQEKIPTDRDPRWCNRKVKKKEMGGFHKGMMKELNLLETIGQEKKEWWNRGPFVTPCQFFQNNLVSCQPLVFDLGVIPPFLMTNKTIFSVHIIEYLISKWRTKLLGFGCEWSEHVKTSSKSRINASTKLALS